MNFDNEAKEWDNARMINQNFWCIKHEKYML